MIGVLPTSLTVDSRTYEINSDYRVALLILQAFNDPQLDDFAKCMVCLKCLYKEIPQNIDAAIERAVWFLDCGDGPKQEKSPKKLMDWEQDEQLIFPALNKVAGYEIRSVNYLHWWSFLGLFNEVGDGLYSQVMNIRAKKAKGKKLDKYEREFYITHRELIDLKPKLTAKEEQELKEELEFIDSLA